MNTMGEWFDNQWFISGNHDDRVARKTQGQIYLEMLLDDTPTSFSTYCYMYVFMPSLQEWVYVCHQYNYSKNSQNLARQIYNVESAPDGYDNFTGERIWNYNYDLDAPNKSKCHVVIGHTHQQQEGWSEDGLYRCVGPGFKPVPRTVLRFPPCPALTTCAISLSVHSRPDIVESFPSRAICHDRPCKPLREPHRASQISLRSGSTSPGLHQLLQTGLPTSTGPKLDSTSFFGTTAPPGYSNGAQMMVHHELSAPLENLEQRIKEFIPVCQHDAHIIACVEEAITAVKEGNIGVGAVIVDTYDEIVQHGHNRVFQPYFRSDLHAEMDVMNRFEDRFRDITSMRPYTLFTSLEPCPMCFVRLISAGVGRVFYAAPDAMGSMVHRLDHLPPAWIDLAATQEFAQADCSKDLSDIAYQVFRLTAAIDLPTLKERRG